MTNPDKNQDKVQLIINLNYANETSQNTEEEQNNNWSWNFLKNLRP